MAAFCATAAALGLCPQERRWIRIGGPTAAAGGLGNGVPVDGWGKTPQRVGGGRRGGGKGDRGPSQPGSSPGSLSRKALPTLCPSPQPFALGSLPPHPASEGTSVLRPRRSSLVPALSPSWMTNREALGGIEEAVGPPPPPNDAENQQCLCRPALCLPLLSFPPLQPQSSIPTSLPRKATQRLAGGDENNVTLLCGKAAIATQGGSRNAPPVARGQQETKVPAHRVL